jgi:hypothetical protein
MGHSGPMRTWFQPERSIELPALSNEAVSRLSMLCGLAAAEVFSIYAVFVAHALMPVEVFMVDRLTNRILVPGSIGNLEEVFNWNGLLPCLLFTSITFTLTWWTVRWATSMPVSPAAAPLDSIETVAGRLAIVSE